MMKATKALKVLKIQAFRLDQIPQFSTNLPQVSSNLLPRKMGSFVAS